jgi:hypothetical protein
VARAIGQLPLVREKFRRGELSYSKVRAITRIANSEIEGELVELARFATAAQVERVASGYRRSVSLASAQAAHRDRFLSYEWNDDGSLCIRGRLAPEDGALLLQALAASEDALWAQRDTESEGSQGGSAEPEPSPRANRVDALVEVAEAYLGRRAKRRSPAERYQVVVHADAAALAGSGEEAGSRIEDGPGIAAETVRRLSCEASLLPVLHRQSGELDVGRKTRAVSPAMRRVLQLRDEGRCQFPGCENHKRVEAHHIMHWARGGETKIDNLVLLCPGHHRLVHEGRVSVLRRADGQLVFRRPDGQPVPTVPSPIRGRCGELRARNRRQGPPVAARTASGTGEPMDRGFVVAELLARAGP